MSATKVETFECDEVANESSEVCREAAELIESLGLDGQKAFLPRDEAAEGKRCPYRVMTAEEEAVYSILCPVQMKAKNYSASAVPVRVLQIASHAKETIDGVELYIWDKELSVVRDPVLVGYVGAYYETGHKKYILARWGSELEAFVSLRNLAVNQAREALENVGRRFLDGLAKATDAALLKNRNASMPDF